jgi:hypothetical protein
MTLEGSVDVELAPLTSHDECRKWAAEADNCLGNRSYTIAAEEGLLALYKVAIGGEGGAIGTLSLVERETGWEVDQFEISKTSIDGDSLDQEDADSLQSEVGDLLEAWARTLPPPPLPRLLNHVVAPLRRLLNDVAAPLDAEGWREVEADREWAEGEACYAEFVNGSRRARVAMVRSPDPVGMKPLAVELRRLGRFLDSDGRCRWVDVVLVVATNGWTAGAIELAEARCRPRCVLLEQVDGELVAVGTSSSLRDEDFELAGTLGLPLGDWDEW